METRSGTPNLGAFALIDFVSSGLGTHRTDHVHAHMEEGAIEIGE